MSKLALFWQKHQEILTINVTFVTFVLILFVNIFTNTIILSDYFVHSIVQNSYFDKNDIEIRIKIYFLSDSNYDIVKL